MKKGKAWLLLKEPRSIPDVGRRDPAIHGSLCPPGRDWTGAKGKTRKESQQRGASVCMCAFSIHRHHPPLPSCPWLSVPWGPTLFGWLVVACCLFLANVKWWRKAHAQNAGSRAVCGAQLPLVETRPPCRNMLVRLVVDRRIVCMCLCGTLLRVVHLCMV